MGPFPVAATMRQAHPSHAGHRGGVFRGFGALDDPPITVNDGLVVLSSSGEQQWQTNWAQSCMDKVNAPSGDIVYQLTGSDCGSNASQDHSPLNLLIPQMIQHGYVPLVETTVFLTGAYFSRVIFTTNSETIRQLAGASGTVQPGIGVFAVASQELNPVGVALITQARAIAKGISPAPPPITVAVAKANLVGKSSTALIAVGVVGLIIWAFGSKKKRG
jgi:hypothetical protein